MNKMHKILIISYNCLSLSKSNGRTLFNLIHRYSSENISQIFMCNESPDFLTYKNYYRITDNDVLNMLIFKKTHKKIIPSTNMEEDDTLFLYKKGIKNRKNYKFRVLRDLLWRFFFKEPKELKNFINEFGPDVILLMNGNNSFVTNYAIKIAKRKKIPIVIYNCEDYQLKPYNQDFWHKYIKKVINRSYKKAMKYTTHIIHSTHFLQSKFTTLDSSETSVIYNSSNINQEYIINIAPNKKEIQISYFGNLGLKRYESIIEIADILMNYENVKINIYGSATDEIIDLLSAHPKINYCGIIPYEDVTIKMKKSDILLHVESFDEKIAFDIQSGFSTKIADSLSAGVPLFVYGPKNNDAVSFLIEHNCASVATSKRDMEEKLFNLIHSYELRLLYAKKGIEIARIFFNAEENSKKFIEIIDSIIRRGENNE